MCNYYLMLFFFFFLVFFCKFESLSRGLEILRQADTCRGDGRAVWSRYALRGASWGHPLGWASVRSCVRTAATSPEGRLSREKGANNFQSLFNKVAYSYIILLMMYRKQTPNNKTKPEAYE